MKSVFVTGTDTGIGKTRVSCALMQQLIVEGYRVVGMKPVASGAYCENGRLVNDDALQLMAVANVAAPYELINPYCFAPPIAPHLAALQGHQPILLEDIVFAYQRLAASADVVVVEGVGGWSVPINTTQTMADVAAALHLPVIMVVGMRLGCLNHALLTAEHILRKSLSLAGWVANTLDPNMLALSGNIDTLNTMLPAPMLGVIPYDTSTSFLSNPQLDLAVLQ